MNYSTTVRSTGRFTVTGNTICRYSSSRQMVRAVVKPPSPKVQPLNRIHGSQSSSFWPLSSSHCFLHSAKGHSPAPQEAVNVIQAIRADLAASVPDPPNDEHAIASVEILLKTQSSWPLSIGAGIANRCWLLCPSRFLCSSRIVCRPRSPMPVGFLPAIDMVDILTMSGNYSEDRRMRISSCLASIMA